MSRRLGQSLKVFQPTTLLKECDVLHDLGSVWQSPRSLATVTAEAAGSRPVPPRHFFSNLRQWQTFSRTICGVACVMNPTQPIPAEGVESFPLRVNL